IAGYVPAEPPGNLSAAARLDCGKVGKSTPTAHFADQTGLTYCREVSIKVRFTAANIAPIAPTLGASLHFLFGGKLVQMFVINVAGNAPMVLTAGIVDDQSGGIESLSQLIEIPVDWRPGPIFMLIPAFVVDAVANDRRMIAISLDHLLPGLVDLLARFLRGVN